MEFYDHNRKFKVKSELALYTAGPLAGQLAGDGNSTENNCGLKNVSYQLRISLDISDFLLIP